MAAITKRLRARFSRKTPMQLLGVQRKLLTGRQMLQPRVGVPGEKPHPSVDRIEAVVLGQIRGFHR